MATGFLSKLRALRVDDVREHAVSVWRSADYLTRQGWGRAQGLYGEHVGPHVDKHVAPLWARAGGVLGSGFDQGLLKLGLRAPRRSIGLSIVLLNLFGALLLVAAILLFSPYQAWLINSKRESLLGQGTILAATVSNHAVAQSGRVALDPALLDPSQTEQLKATTKQLGTLRLPFRMDKVAPAMRQSLDGTGMRARLYSTSGDLVLDTDELFGVRQPDEVVPADQIGVPLHDIWTRFSDWMDGTELPVYRDIGRAKGTLYPEVLGVLSGEKATPLMLMNERGRRMVGIVVPVQRPGTVFGALVLSTREGEIDKLVWRERRAILWLATFGVMAMVFSSWLLSRKIATPLRELSLAAERVQSNLSRREELPDHSKRGDEIGDLSHTLRAMTDALYQRIEASERFAADVAHELKNPLCSVRNAAETLPLVKNDADRAQLTGLIQNDVKRLTRLIDDISKATRVVAEMAFTETRPVDVADVLKAVVDVGNDVHVKNLQRVTLSLDPGLFIEPFTVEGHDTRLGQVFKNLVDNALSFSPPEGVVSVHARRAGERMVVTVEDQGPGIPHDNFDRIFMRFYTDRPEQHFGNNSGLGLSICKEIVEAHHGRIWAENLVENVVHRSGTSDLGVVDSRVLGARFTVELLASSSVVKGPRRGQAAR
jgi:two-component system, OmpR family, sensor histidine kinase ChvG